MNEMTFAELLSLLQNSDEVERIEAKQSTEVIGKSVQETICAFCNEPDLGGGYLILGLMKNDPSNSTRYLISGVKDPDKLQREIVSLCRQNFSILIRPTLEVIHQDNCSLILVYIPEAEAHEKPVYIHSRGIEKGTFRRIGPADLLCGKEDIDLFYQLRSRKKFDDTAISESSKSDFDPKAIEMYRKYRKDVFPNAKELEWDDDELLQALGATTEIGGRICSTVAGLVLFGNEVALRRFLPMDTRIDYIIIDGTEWVPRPDLRYYSIEIREALLLAIPRVISLILRDIPKTFYLKPGDLARKDVSLIPEVVIREAVCNAVMHRDYRANQAMQILRYTNRIEFRNPGYSLKPVDQLGLPGSIPRNTKIPSVLHDLNFAETKGSGIRTMQEASREANLTVPLFESSREINNFSLTLLTHHLFDERDVQWLSRFKDSNLTDDEARTLIVLREMGAITNADCRNMNRMDTLSASVHLRRLRDIGLIEQKGRGNATYYIPTTKLLGLDHTSYEAGTEKTAPQVNTKPDGLTPQVNTKPDGLASQNCLNLDQSLRTQDVQDLEEKVKAMGKRPSVHQVKEIIKKLCSLKPFKPQEIADILKRNQKYVRDTYLTPMVEASELELIFPNTPAHPQQAYRTKK